MASHDGRRLPLFEFQRIHAKILRQRGEYQAAHEAFRAALATARRWRFDLLPADSFRIAGESSLAPLYDAALENYSLLYASGHNPEIIAEAWLQAEDWRASSLRHSLIEGQDWKTKVGQLYWEILAEFRRLDFQ